MFRIAPFSPLLGRLALLGLALLPSVGGQAAAAGRQASAPPATTSSLSVARIFGDSMVLQRDTPIPVWGWDTPGTMVTVTVAGSRAEARADAQGRWKAVLAPLPAGGPHTLRVSGSRDLEFSDVLIGDVWICSGQSNMNWPLNRPNSPVEGGKEAAEAAANPRLRLMQVPRRVSQTPEADLKEARWLPSSPESASGFSAVGYFFGRELQKHLDIPVGLIHVAWGGTSAQAWTSEETLLSLPPVADQVKAIRAAGTDPEQLKAWREEAWAAWDRMADAHDAGSTGGVSWADPSLETGDWEEAEVPLLPAGHPSDRNGIVWYRRQVEVPASLAATTAVLSLGRVQDNDVAWVNGVKVGETTGSRGARAYQISPGVLREGTNTVAVRLWNAMRKPRFLDTADHFSLSDTLKTTSVSLAGTWKHKMGADFSRLPVRPPDPLGPNRPAGLFNGMISPLIPFAFKGVIWYQGENNAYRPWEYRTLLAGLIRDWRQVWGAGDFPFLFVQLPEFEAGRSGAAEDAWAEIREAQAATLRLPATGMAVALGLGDPGDIHPARKEEVGRRLFLAARKVAYGEQVSATGPVYRPGSARAEGGAMRLEFDGAEKGLVARDGTLRGFEIAGPDRRFHPAEARIEGNAVIVRSDGVAEPAAVRYAWSNCPEASLFGGDGLPASPFRTDDWPLREE